MSDDRSSIIVALRERGYDFLRYYVRRTELHVSDSYLFHPTEIRVFSLHTMAFLKQCPQKSGYLHVALCHNGHRLDRQVHQLVWNHCVGPIPEGQEPDHRNDVRSDNRIENLQLLTHVENARKARLHSGKNLERVVLATNLETKEEKRYISVSSCGRDLGINPGPITLVMSGKQKTLRDRDGQKWTFSGVKDDGAIAPTILVDRRKTKGPRDPALNAMSKRIALFKKRVRPIVTQTFAIDGPEITPPKRQTQPYRRTRKQDFDAQ